MPWPTGAYTKQDIGRAPGRDILRGSTGQVIARLEPREIAQPRALSTAPQAAISFQARRVLKDLLARREDEREAWRDDASRALMTMPRTPPAAILRRARWLRRSSGQTVQPLTVLTKPELARWLHVSERTIDRLHPPALALTDGARRYLVADILKWLDARRHAI